MAIDTRRLPGIAVATSALLSVFEFASLDEWRATTLGSLRALFDAPKGFLYTPLPGTIDVHVEHQGVEAVQMMEYFRDWVEQDFAEAAWLKERGLSVATREIMWHGNGAPPEFAATYAKSELWNEYHKKWGMLEGAGYFQTHEPDPQTVVISSGFWVCGDNIANTMYFSEGEEIVTALAPAFLAGMKLARLRAALAGSIPLWIDELPGALAMMDSCGRVVHQNRTWLETVGNASALDLDAAVTTIARTTVSGHLRGSRVSAPATRVAVGDILLTATPLRLPDYPDAFVLILAEVKTPQAVDYHAHALQLGLPRRMAQVAALIAAGHSNAEIASTLGIRESTARRQTERVLKRLGVARRAGVAARLVSHGMG